MMEINEARDIALRWQKVTEQGAKCEVFLNDSLTQTHEWGWVFYFAPKVITNSTIIKQYRVAVEGSTGRSCPVGTKGLARVLEYFKYHRERDSSGPNPRHPICPQ
jgi:hypothetical protein